MISEYLGLVSQSANDVGPLGSVRSASRSRRHRAGQMTQCHVPPDLILSSIRTL